MKESIQIMDLTKNPCKIMRKNVMAMTDRNEIHQNGRLSPLFSQSADATHNKFFLTSTT